MFRWLCQLSALSAQEPAGVALRPGNPERIGSMVVFGASFYFADWALVFKCQEILKDCKCDGQICVTVPDAVCNLAEYYGFGLFKNIPWFTQLWTVQEVVMAREALLVFGEDTLPLVRLDGTTQFRLAWTSLLTMTLRPGRPRRTLPEH